MAAATFSRVGRRLLILLLLACTCQQVFGQGSFFLDNEQCDPCYTCVPRSRCAVKEPFDDGGVLDDGAGEFEIRQGDGPFMKICEFQNVCCPEKDTLPEVSTGVPSAQMCSDFAGYRCVPVRRCSNGNIIAEDEDIVNLRQGLINIDPSKSKCPGSLEVCCNEDDITRPEARPPPQPKEQVKSKGGVKIAPTCGAHNPGGVEIRVAGNGAGAQFGEWPSTCMLLRTTTASIQNNLLEEALVGGATLIAPGLALTAATILRDISDPKGLIVRCGEWDTKSDSEPLPHQELKVMRITVHPSYKSKAFYDNNAAVLHLESDFVLDEHIGVACLPDERDGVDSYESTGCFATGWGREQFSDDSLYQTVLDQVNLPLHKDRRVCDDMLVTNVKDRKLPNGFALGDSYFCAGGGRQDTCKGDGGGPLMCPSRGNPNIYVQAGITAWGFGCFQPGVPGVYTNVADSVCFIKWAARCAHGAKYDDYLGIGDACENFFADERSELEALRRSTNSDAVRRYVQDSLSQLTDMERNCGYSVLEQKERSPVDFRQAFACVNLEKDPLPPAPLKSSTSPSPSSPSSSPQGVIVASVRRLTAPQAQYDDARAAISSLMSSQPGFVTEAEFDGYLALDHVFYFSPPIDPLTRAPKTVRVAMMEFDSLDSFKAAMSNIETSSQWNDLSLVSEEECQVAMQNADGKKTSLSAFPSSPSLTELIIGHVRERKESEYEEKRPEFVRFLKSFNGVGNVVDYRPAPGLGDPSLRVTSAVFDSRDSIDAYARGLFDDDVSPQFFNTFVTDCHYVLKRFSR